MVQEMNALETSISQQLQAVSEASRLLVKLNDEEIGAILNEVADLAIEETPYILAENQKDLDRMDPTNPKYDRLLLSA